jgi:hypothetical protein
MMPRLPRAAKSAANERLHLKDKEIIVPDADVSDMENESDSDDDELQMLPLFPHEIVDLDDVSVDDDQVSIHFHRL